MARCKGLCELKKETSFIHGVSRYLQGQKYCKSCGIWIVWDNIRCPCCSYPLKIRPNNRKNKEALTIYQGQNMVYH